MELTQEELHKIDGGAISWGILTSIAAAVVYIIGCVSGYTNPTRCNNK